MRGLFIQFQNKILKKDVFGVFLVLEIRIEKKYV